MLAGRYSLRPMSIQGNFRWVEPGQLDALLAAPEQENDFLPAEGQDEGGDEPSRGRALQPQVKSWHALHFLLTGTAWGGSAPLHFIAVGGRRVVHEDFGYGPARAFAPREVKAICQALEDVSPADMRRRFDAAKMDELEIYPKNWSENADEDSLDAVLGDFEALRDFLREGAEQDLGLLVYLD